jgi:hypothetical protein
MSYLASAVEFPADIAETKWGQLRESNLEGIPESLAAMETAE